MLNGNAEEVQAPPGVTPPPQQQITMANINGRLSELSDLNAALTARCATMRGQLAEKDEELAKLTKELMSYRQKDAAHAKTTVLHKGNGKQKREAL